MTAQACADLVARGDPQRFAATLAAPPETRARLFPLYAFNLELARAPWVTAEPMIAEMRLQWWRDAVAEAGQGAPARPHEVMTPLAGVIRTHGLPPHLFDDMAEARLSDIQTAPFADVDALRHYIDHTAGHLMWLAALTLNAPPEAESPVRAQALGQGLAAYLLAGPDLVQRGRQPLPPGATIPDLALLGLDALRLARSQRRLVPKACRPAVLPAWMAGPTLHRLRARPQETPRFSEFYRRGGLIWQAFTGRW